VGVDFYSVLLTLPLDGGGGAPNDAAVAAATLQLWDVGGGCSAAMAATYAAGADAVLLVHDLATPAVSFVCLWGGNVSLHAALTKRAETRARLWGRRTLQDSSHPLYNTHQPQTKRPSPPQRLGSIRCGLRVMAAAAAAAVVVVDHTWHYSPTTRHHQQQRQQHRQQQQQQHQSPPGGG
jgi:hypothetical protein